MYEDMLCMCSVASQFVYLIGVVTSCYVRCSEVCSSIFTMSLNILKTSIKSPTSLLSEPRYIVPTSLHLGGLELKGQFYWLWTFTIVLMVTFSEPQHLIVGQCIGVWWWRTVLTCKVCNSGYLLSHLILLSHKLNICEYAYPLSCTRKVAEH